MSESQPEERTSGLGLDEVRQLIELMIEHEHDGVFVSGDPQRRTEALNSVGAVGQRRR